MDSNTTAISATSSSAISAAVASGTGSSAVSVAAANAAAASSKQSKAPPPPAPPPPQQTQLTRDPRSLQFQVEGNRVITTIVDENNNTVVVQIPDADMIQLAKSIDRMKGFLVQEKA